MNHNDTLAKYVRSVCFASIDTPSIQHGTIFIGENGQKFKRHSYYDDPLKIGDTVFIAKPIAVLKNMPKRYEIHEIIVPIPRWTFTMIEKEKDSKKRRLMIKDTYQTNVSIQFKHRACVTQALVLI